MTVNPLDQIIGTPFEFGGREPGVALDCLGVAIVVCRHHGVELPDPWLQVQQAWRMGCLDVETLFPAQWDRVLLASSDGLPLRDADVIVTPGHISAASGGYVYGTLEHGEAFREPAPRFLRRRLRAGAVAVWRRAA